MNLLVIRFKIIQRAVKPLLYPYILYYIIYYTCIQRPVYIIHVMPRFLHINMFISFPYNKSGYSHFTTRQDILRIFYKNTTARIKLCQHLRNVLVVSHRGGYNKINNSIPVRVLIALPHRAYMY